MIFGMIVLKSIKTMQNCAIWILTVLLLILKLKIFINKLQMKLKNDLIHQVKNLMGHFGDMNKKVMVFFMNELGGKNMT